MKQLLGKTLVLAACMAALLTVSAFAGEVNVGIVNADALRLRSEASTTSSTITYLNSGVQVEILEDQGDWYYVSCDGVTGYVYASYISFRSSGSVTAAAPAESVAGQTGVITGSLVNFRGGPSTDDAILTTIEEGGEVSIISIDGDWCLAQRDGQEGYVKADYVSVNGIPLVDPRGVITGDCVNVRNAPSTEGGIVARVYAGDLVDLIALENEWYTVSCDGQTGYIRSDFLKVYAGETAGGLGSDIVETAKKYLGTRYSYGGASSRGFDCSGFTMYIFGLYGYSLPHSATSQWYDCDTTVSRSELQPGDLVFFCDPSRSNGKTCSHVGIYVGNDDFIHASSGSNAVRISSLNESYYGGYYIGGKRLA